MDFAENVLFKSKITIGHLMHDHSLHDYTAANWGDLKQAPRRSPL